MIHSIRTFAVLWLAVTTAAWYLLVPALVSMPAFLWASAALIATFSVVLGIALNARPTASVARVLYDVEHQRRAR